MAKVMISMPEDVLARLDAAARAEGRSRSELLRAALRLYLASSSNADRAQVVTRLRSRLAGVPTGTPLEDLVRKERRR